MIIPIYRPPKKKAMRSPRFSDESLDSGGILVEWDFHGASRPFHSAIPFTR
jgi:hypothetical protein